MLGATSAAAITASTSVSERIANLAPTSPNMAEYGALVAGQSVFAGSRLYLDPQSSGHRAAAAEQDPGTRALLTTLAGQPKAAWFGGWIPTGSVTAAVAEVVRAAAAQGAVPVLVAYEIPGRDCGGYSAGGAGSPAAYRAWIEAFAAGLGDSPAAVVIEPDALGHLGCLTATQREERFALLRHAVTVLAARPGVSTYLDASHWVPAAEMAAHLEQAGVAGARGFALNVSAFETTPRMTDHGRAISGAIGGKPFVIDTSRNGSGPLGRDWCNPAGRSLGERPLSPVPDPAVDALLWVKIVGESDGDCGRGEPPAGTFFPGYAAALVARSPGYA